MTSFDVLLMVVDFLFLSTSVAFVFSTIKESIEVDGQKTEKKIFSIVIFSFIAFLIPLTLYYIYLVISFHILYIISKDGEQTKKIKT